jgi:hypothetical protein
MYFKRIVPLALGLLFVCSCAAGTPPICAPAAAWDSGRDQAAAGHAYRYELGGMCSDKATEAKFREGYTAGVALFCVPGTAYAHGKSTASAGQAAAYDARRYGICTQQNGFPQAYADGHAAGVAALCVPTAGAKHGYDMGLAGRASQFDARAYALCSPGQVAGMTAEYSKAHAAGVVAFCGQAGNQARAQGVEAGRRGSSESFDEAPYGLCSLPEIRRAFQDGKVAGLQEFCSPAAATQMGQQQGQAGAAANFDGRRYGACSSSQQSQLRQAYRQGHSEGIGFFCRGLEDTAVAASLELGRQGLADTSRASFGNCPRAIATNAQRAAQQAYREGLNEFCQAADAEAVWTGGNQGGDPLRPYRLCSPQQVAALQTRYNRVVQARLASFCSEGRLRRAAAELAVDGNNFQLPISFTVCLESYPDTARRFSQLVQIEREAVIASQCSYQAGEAQGRLDASENRRKETRMPGFCDRNSFNVYLTGYLDGWKGNLCSEDTAYGLGLRDATEGRARNYRAPRGCDQQRRLADKYANGYREGKRNQGGNHGDHQDHRRPGRAQNWSSDPSVIRECGRRFDGTANEQACMDLMTRVFYQPIAMIEACDSAMDGDRNELACIRLGVTAVVDPGSSIEACDRTMDGDTNELACIGLTVRSRRPLARPIAACDSAMDGDSNELQCIKTIAQSRYDTSDSISACDSAMDGDRNELLCIGAIASARRDSVQIISACDDAMSGDSSELECIRKAVR